MYKNLLIQDIKLENLIKKKRNLYFEDDITEKDIDDLENQTSVDVKNIDTNKIDELYSHLHKNNPIFKYFNGKTIKIIEFSQVKSLLSKDTTTLSKIGFVISMLGLYLFSSISFSSTLIKKESVNTDVSSKNLIKEMINLEMYVENTIKKEAKYITENDILKKVSLSIKVLYYAKKIIKSISSVLVKLYGGGTQILYVLTLISLAVISCIFFVIGTLLISNQNKDLLNSLASSCLNILKNEGTSKFKKTSNISKFELIKYYASLCFSFTIDLVKYIPQSLKESFTGIWNSIKKLPKLIQNFFSENIDINNLTLPHRKKMYKEEVFVEFFNPFNMIKNLLMKLFKHKILAPGILVLSLIVIKNKVPLPDGITTALDQNVEVAKKEVKRITDLQQKISSKNKSSEN